jgi:hypothetical protein
MRQRIMLNGRDIQSLQQVTRSPDAPEGSLDPAHFQPVVEAQSGDGGIWVCPREGEAPEHAVRGMQYPVHIDRTSLQPYVILLRAGQPDEVRYEIPIAPRHADGGMNPDFDTGANPGRPPARSGGWRRGHSARRVRAGVIGIGHLTSHRGTPQGVPLE